MITNDSSYALAPDFRLGNKYKVDRRITRDSKRDLQVAGIVQFGLAVIDDKTRQGLNWLSKFTFSREAQCRGF